MSIGVLAESGCWLGWILQPVRGNPAERFWLLLEADTAQGDQY